jgi:hypothetical protein
MDGLGFVRGDHFTIGDGCYLPYADLLGLVQARLHELIYNSPDVKNYVPNLLDVDVFVMWKDDRFVLLISPDKRAHLPTRGMMGTHREELNAAGQIWFQQMPAGFHDISSLTAIKGVFKEIKFLEGFAALGTFPSGTYDDESKAKKHAASVNVAQLLITWAKDRKHAMENSRVFLSHKGRTSH